MNRKKYSGGFTVNRVFRRNPEKIPAQYPWMNEDNDCELCIIGGGITGAMCALKAAENGRSVVLIDANEIGFGATRHLPQVAEADMGMTLTELTKKVTIDEAARIYDVGFQALEQLEGFEKHHGAAASSFGFRRRDSFIYTDDESESELIRREYIARKRSGFKSSYITRETAHDSFGFNICGGILTRGFGATVDAYALTHLCLKLASNIGAKIFEHTCANDIETPSNGGSGVIVTTSADREIHAEKLLLATGSAGIQAILSSFRKRTLYSSASFKIPSENEGFWPGRCIIRSFESPNITFSLTSDDKIAASGLESRIAGNGLKIGNLLSLPSISERKFDNLDASVKYMFPSAEISGSQFSDEFQYSAAHDGLPLIGEHPDYPDCIFALCTGKSAVLFSQLAANFINDTLDGQPNEYADIFSPERFAMDRQSTN